MNPLQYRHSILKVMSVGGIPATWNPNDKAANISLSDGNLTTTRSGAGPASVRATVGKNSGKHYFEIKCISSSFTFDVWVGFSNKVANLVSLPGQSSADGNAWAIALDGGDYYHNGFIAAASSTWPAAVDDVFGFAWNADGSNISLYRQNVLLTPTPLFTGMGGLLYPIITTQSNTTVMTANFGATNMTYTAPTGYIQGLYS